MASILYQQTFSQVKNNLFKCFAFKVLFGACTELQVPFPIYLPLLCSMASMSLSPGAAETSVQCVATLVSSHSSLSYGKSLVVFFLSLLDSVLSCFISTRFFLWFPCSSPTSLSLSSPTAVLLFLFIACLMCVLWWHRNNPKCFVLLSAGAQPGTFAGLAVHLQDLSLKALILGWNRQNWETQSAVESKLQCPDWKAQSL